jgi:hypothetical protein
VSQLPSVEHNVSPCFTAGAAKMEHLVRDCHAFPGAREVVLWQIAGHSGIFELARLWTNELQRLISREGRAGTRMIRMTAAWRGSANSAPRPHRDGRTAYIQCRRLVI